MNATTGTPLAVWPSQTRAGTVAPSCSSSTILVVVCRVTSIGVAPGGRGWGVAAGSSHPHRAALTGRSSHGQALGSLGVDVLTAGIATGPAPAGRGMAHPPIRVALAVPDVHSRDRDRRIVVSPAIPVPGVRGVV